MPRLSTRERTRRFTLLRLIIFVILTGTLTAFVGMQIARIGLGGGSPIEATFDDASGLNKGDQVKIAGAPVGQVSGIKVVNGRARVKLSVKKHIVTSLPADSEAAIRWRNAIGQRVVYLLPGTSQDRLRPGSHITRTRSVVDIGELVNRIAPLTRSLDPNQINVLLTSVAQALEGNEGNITQLVRNVDTLASTISARRQTLQQMLRDYNTVTGVLARRDGQIAKMIDNLVTLTGAFTSNRQLVEASLVQLSATAATTDKVIGRNSEQLGTIIERLVTLTSGTRRNIGTLSAIFNEATPKLQRIFSLTDNGRFITVAVPCISLAGPPCPFAMRLPGSREGPGRLKTSKDLQRLIVGGR